MRHVLPRHVRACQHSADQSERWFVWTWSKTAPEHQVRVPYSCNSWRCAGTCRRYEASVCFKRIQTACKPLRADGWVFLVLTLDREGYYGGRKWRDVTEAYRELRTLGQKTRERIGRVYGPVRKWVGSEHPRVVRSLGNRWVSVTEAHRSGWPHVNLLLWCPELADELRRDQQARLEDPELANAVELARDAWQKKEPLPPAVRELARKARTIGGAFADLIRDAGWGLQSTAEAARSTEALAGYFVKLAGAHESAVGEISKVTQVPMNAPVRFRRLRSGKGFLPPRDKDESVTGCLCRRRRSAEGDWESIVMNAPADQAHAEPTRRALACELLIAQEEEAILSRTRGRLPAMPPIRMAVGGRLIGHRETSERRAAMQRRSETDS